LVSLGVKTLFFSIKNVISRNRYQPGIEFASGSRQIFGARGIYRESAIMIKFTTVDIGPSGTVDYEVRMAFRDRTCDSVSICNVQALVIERKNLVAAELAVFRNSATDHSACSGYQDFQPVATSAPYCCR
jgi:hypothetical protein